MNGWTTRNNTFWIGNRQHIENINMKYTYIRSDAGYVILEWHREIATVQDEGLAIEMVNLFNDNEELIEFN